MCGGWLGVIISGVWWSSPNSFTTICLSVNKIVLIDNRNSNPHCSYVFWFLFSWLRWVAVAPLFLTLNFTHSFIGIRFHGLLLLFRSHFHFQGGSQPPSPPPPTTQPKSQPQSQSISPFSDFQIALWSVIYYFFIFNIHSLFIHSLSHEIS